jgi:hypothetical protein
MSLPKQFQNVVDKLEALPTLIGKVEEIGEAIAAVTELRNSHIALHEKLDRLLAIAEGGPAAASKPAQTPKPTKAKADASAEEPKG